MVNKKDKCLLLGVASTLKGDMENKIVTISCDEDFGGRIIA